ncbi:hypothetical protein V6Z12_D10G284300 [Gossypium hirsutum]
MHWSRCFLFVVRFDTQQNLQIMDGSDILFLTNKTSSHEIPGIKVTFVTNAKYF